MDKVLTTRPSLDEKNRRSLNFKEICIWAEKTRKIQHKNIHYIYTGPLINKMNNKHGFAFFIKRLRK